MNHDLVRLAHTGSNPELIRRLVDESGFAGAVRRMRSSPKTPRYARDALSVPIDQRMNNLAALDIELVGVADVRYPHHLRDLPDHPLWLFVRGRDARTAGVAIVGSRKATRYGLELSRILGRRVAAAGWPVVSGLAAGVDAEAHRGALEANGQTVAVLGSGIDVWYPRRNAGLGSEILAEGGCVVSEFPPGTTPEPWRFPARNRIISGLSEVVIVVEAALRSGALITARMAVDHGRFVLAVPGDLTRATSAGTNLLIRDGAHPLTDVDALIEELELVMGPAPTTPAVSLDDDDPLLSLIGPVSRTIDDLASAADLDVSTLLVGLTQLELAGRIVIADGRVRGI